MKNLLIPASELQPGDILLRETTNPYWRQTRVVGVHPAPGHVHPGTLSVVHANDAGVRTCFNIRPTNPILVKRVGVNPFLEV